MAVLYRPFVKHPVIRTSPPDRFLVNNGPNVAAGRFLRCEKYWGCPSSFAFAYNRAIFDELPDSFDLH
jgi:hypothetical protein